MAARALTERASAGYGTATLSNGGTVPRQSSADSVRSRHRLACGARARGSESGRTQTLSAGKRRTPLPEVPGEAEERSPEPGGQAWFDRPDDSETPVEWRARQDSNLGPPD